MGPLPPWTFEGLVHTQFILLDRCFHTFSLLFSLIFLLKTAEPTLFSYFFSTISTDISLKRAVSTQFIFIPFIYYFQLRGFDASFHT